MIQAWDFVNANILWQCAPPDALLDKSLLELEFSVRVINALYHQRRSTHFGPDGHTFEPDPIKTVRELIQFSEAELMREVNFGRKSLQEVKEVLGYHGLALRSTATPQTRTVHWRFPFPLTAPVES